MKQIDAIVAGAGVWGCTVARRLAEAGRHMLVLEKRKAVGGNCRALFANSPAPPSFAIGRISSR